MRRFRPLWLITVLAFVASALVAVGAPTAAQAQGSCTISGNTLSWSNVGASDYNVRKNGSWYRTVNGTSTTIDDPGASWIVRHRANGQTVDRSCTPGGGGGGGGVPADGCTLSGNQLSWSDVGKDEYYVQKNGSWFRNVRGLTTTIDNANATWAVRHWTGGNPIDRACSAGGGGGGGGAPAPAPAPAPQGGCELDGNKLYWTDVGKDEYYVQKNGSWFRNVRGLTTTIDNANATWAVRHWTGGNPIDRTCPAVGQNPVPAPNPGGGQQPDLFDQVQLRILQTPVRCNGADITIWFSENSARVSRVGSTYLINGTGGRDVIWGSPGVDVINGNGGDDVICGNSGDDRITGGSGADVVSGGPGKDTIAGGDGNDRLYGNGGKDVITGEKGDDLVQGGIGDDRINGGNNDDTVRGGPGNDILTAGRGNDSLIGGDGNDTLKGVAGTNWLEGGDGTDEYEPGSGYDSCRDNSPRVVSPTPGVHGCELYYPPTTPAVAAPPTPNYPWSGLSGAQIASELRINANQVPTADEVRTTLARISTRWGVIPAFGRSDLRITEADLNKELGELVLYNLSRSQEAAFNDLIGRMDPDLLHAWGREAIVGLRASDITYSQFLGLQGQIGKVLGTSVMLNDDDFIFATGASEFMTDNGSRLSVVSDLAEAGGAAIAQGQQLAEIVIAPRTAKLLAGLDALSTPALALNAGFLAAELQDGQFNPAGSKQDAAELVSLVAAGGSLLFSGPVGWMFLAIGIVAGILSIIFDDPAEFRDELFRSTANRTVMFLNRESFDALTADQVRTDTKVMRVSLEWLRDGLRGRADARLQPDLTGRTGQTNYQIYEADDIMGRGWECHRNIPRGAVGIEIVGCSGFQNLMLTGGQLYSAANLDNTIRLLRVGSRCRNANASVDCQVVNSTILK